MKYFFFAFLLLINFTWANEKKAENEEAYLLMGFQKFKVIALLPFFEKVDQKIIYDTMAEAFKKYGQVVVSEKKSVFQSLLQLDTQDPICFFVIDKDEEQITVSLEILAEVEVLANKHKTVCAIWKKNLSLSISSEMKNQTELTIANLICEMIDDLSKDWIKANTDSKQLIFHINKFQDL
jgi:hypothetical protein